LLAKFSKKQTFYYTRRITPKRVTSLRCTTPGHSAKGNTATCVDVEACASVAGGRGGLWPCWIFLNDTDKVEEGLMVLFLRSRFFPTLLEIFLPTLLC